MKLGAILDDVTTFGNINQTLNALHYTKENGPLVGLSLSNKTKIWFPFNPYPTTQLPPYVSVIQDRGAPLLGAAVSCDSEYLNSICAKRIDKWRQCIKAMAPLADPQLEALLLRSCNVLVRQK